METVSTVSPRELALRAIDLIVAVNTFCLRTSLFTPAHGAPNPTLLDGDIALSMQNYT
jgi:hypothetical protein